MFFIFLLICGALCYKNPGFYYQSQPTTPTSNIFNPYNNGRFFYNPGPDVKPGFMPGLSLPTSSNISPQIGNRDHNLNQPVNQSYINNTSFADGNNACENKDFVAGNISQTENSEINYEPSQSENTNDQNRGNDNKSAQNHTQDETYEPYDIDKVKNNDTNNDNIRPPPKKPLTTTTNRPRPQEHPYVIPSRPPRPPPPSTRPPPTYSGPATMAEQVPTLREFYAPSLQWHVGIYTKTFTPYMQVCGGSLVKADVVLSAAHCFWKDDIGALRPALFAVAAGKLLRPWTIQRDSFAQRSDVKDIKIPSRFQGARTSFQDDIAIVLLASPFELAPGVKPLCVSFDVSLEREQLRTGNMGTIAGWGLTEPNGLPSQRLNFVKLPYVEIDECIQKAEFSFLKYITSDKICAGDKSTGRALCRGDSGGGLVYYKGNIPYLRGIASTAERDSNECNAFAIASFTHVGYHRVL